MENTFTISDTFKLKIITIKDIQELSEVSNSTAQRIYKEIKTLYKKKRITMYDYIKYYCVD